MTKPASERPIIQTSSVATWKRKSEPFAITCSRWAAAASRPAATDTRFRTKEAGLTACLFFFGRKPPSFTSNSKMSRKVHPMKSAKMSILLFLGAVLVLPALILKASDPVGVYAVIDKVVLEPGETSPQRIQIWGTTLSITAY